MREAATILATHLSAKAWYAVCAASAGMRAAVSQHLLLQVLLQLVHAHAQVEVQLHGAVLHKHIPAPNPQSPITHVGFTSRT